jgi:hypothetical protein
LNNSTVPFHDVRVSATLYDSNNQSLVERTHTSPSGIQPGVNASFDINIFGTSITGGINYKGQALLRISRNDARYCFDKAKKLGFILVKVSSIAAAVSCWCGTTYSIEDLRPILIWAPLS